MTKKNIILILVIVIVAIGGSVLLWQSGQKPPAKYTGPVEKIRFAGSKAGIELNSLVWIAEEKGYFKDQGLDVEITQEVNGPAAQEKVSAGSADIAGTSDFAFVSDSFNLNNLKILTCIDHAKVVDVVARKDSGISVPSDLVGKKIGVTFKTAAEFFLGNFLITNNILANQISAVNMLMVDEPDAIANGKVDAVITNDPYVYDSKNALGENGIDWPAQGEQDVFWIVVGNEQFLKNHPKTTERFIVSLLSAENFIKANSEKSRQIVKEKFALSQNYIEQNWPKHDFKLDFPQSLLVIIEDEARWAIDNKITNKTEIPDYLNFLYLDALEKINPEAMTVIH